MRCNIIGAGRLGMHFAYALKHNQLASLAGIYNEHPQSSRKAVKGLDGGKAVYSLKHLPPADLIVITVPDDRLAALVDELVQSNRVQPDCLIIHCSGALPSSILLPLKSKKCFIGTVHPLKAFQKNNLNKDVFKDVDCVIEGDEEVKDWLKKIFHQLGANVVTLPSKNKAMYHAAAVIASNYLVTLAHLSTTLLTQAGIDHTEAHAMTGRLMQSSLNHIKDAKTAAEALTGPVSRADIETIQLHLKAIATPEIARLYQTLGQATIPLANVSAEQKQHLLTLLQKNDV